MDPLVALPHHVQLTLLSVLV
jgi:hypothetical protein